jgi:MinD superfamily P-loop ATPase
MYEMIITFASGKGGTGKTTIATNLAKVLEDENVVLLDCDVEEPNSHLFLKPDNVDEVVFRTFIPEVDLEKCTFCGKCSELCQFGAIVTIKRNVLVFPELCHGCEGCKLICPTDAISDGYKEIGSIVSGTSEKIKIIYGRLRIGEAMSPPLIQEVKRRGLSENGQAVTIIDAPPGTSCPVITAVKGSDFVVLVTEPTPFGLHDLKLAVEMVKVLRIPFGVIINRSTIGDKNVWNYCKDENIDILVEIPDDRRIATVYSRGGLVVEEIPSYREKFEILFDKLKMYVKASKKVSQ